ncbi:MAG: hypothetical protein CMI18_02885 [Opitutaceae bacterium]|nr:hypothetical protein [Opitutaceae bacterium]|tara:strand:- start:8848 stop:9042 length:195 start_codon:yes stop_codon:yes gene_type:complete
MNREEPRNYYEVGAVAKISGLSTHDKGGCSLPYDVDWHPILNTSLLGLFTFAVYDLTNYANLSH